MPRGRRWPPSGAGVGVWRKGALGALHQAHGLHASWEAVAAIRCGCGCVEEGGAGRAAPGARLACLVGGGGRHQVRVWVCGGRGRWARCTRRTACMPRGRRWPPSGAGVGVWRKGALGALHQAHGLHASWEAVAAIRCGQRPASLWLRTHSFGQNLAAACKQAVCTSVVWLAAQAGGDEAFSPPLFPAPLLRRNCAALRALQAGRGVPGGRHRPSLAPLTHRAQCFTAGFHSAGRTRRSRRTPPTLPCATDAPCPMLHRWLPLCRQDEAFQEDATDPPLRH